MMYDYKEIFSKFEASFKKFNGLSDGAIEITFADYKRLSYKPLTDNAYFELLKFIPFYSGFKAVTVENKRNIINGHFPDFATTAAITPEVKDVIMRDQKMIKSEAKISATIHNARIMTELIKEFGTFHHYLESFKPMESFENTLLLKEDLQSRFQYLGGITVYHFMTDIGLPVLKPDRVITRIFKRLGFINDENALLATVIHGRKFAEATGYSIRYIDILLVKYGQQGASSMLNVKDGICLEENPKCSVCLLSTYCTYKLNNHAAIP